nr:hypothetical protein [Tanacetum cinerariifolium]
KDDEEEGGDDDQEFDEEEYDEETRDEESFDHIPKTLENSKDEGNGKEDLGLNRMNEAIKVAVQIQSDRLHDEAQRENDEFLKTIDENIQKIIKEQVKEQVKRCRDDDADKNEEPSARPDQGSKRRREGKEPESASAPTETATRSAGRSTQGFKSRQASTSESALVEEPVQTTFQIEEPSHPEFDTGAKDQPIVQSSQHLEWFSPQQKPPTSDRNWNKTVLATHESIQPWISELAKRSDSRSSFNELMDTPLDFFNFLINWLKVDTLTSKILAGPTYELMNGSCKSLRRIIAVTKLKIVEWHSYKHLDWITVRRDNDKLYKFKEEACGRSSTG